MSIQFDITDLFNDVKISVDKICREFDIKLNKNLQSYDDIPIKQLYRRTPMLSDDFYDKTIITENSLEKLSLRLYDNPHYWWLILMVNKVNSPFMINMTPRVITIIANYLYRFENKYTEDVYFDLVNEYNEKTKIIKYIKKNKLNEFFRLMLG